MVVWLKEIEWRSNELYDNALIYSTLVLKLSVPIVDPQKGLCYSRDSVTDSLHENTIQLCSKTLT